MNFRSCKDPIHVGKRVFLNEIEPFKTTGLPVNSVLYKGRCGIGGTSMEMKHKRHSIIVVPTVAPIIGKLNLDKSEECVVKDDAFPLMGRQGLKRKVKIKRLEDYLNSNIEHKKILTTPDSFDCIIDAAKNIGKLQWLRDEFFLLLDECHSFVTEQFRKKMIIPFKFMWGFKMKCLISATPFEFSDPKFQELDKYEIIIDEPLGKIKLITTERIKETIHKILGEHHNYPGNVHIFYNSVVQMSECVREFIEENGSLDCNIFCNGSEENMVKLDDLQHLYKEVPGDYKKFNFYTTRYFEAWDLYDQTEVTLILLTDVNSQHATVGISNKGVQALGRYRGPKPYVEGEPYVHKNPYQIIHITNHRATATKLGKEHFSKKHELYAKDAVNKYNEHVRNAIENNVIPSAKMKSSAEDYAEINVHTDIATLNHIMKDQWVNAEVCNEEYNNIEFIKEAWERSNYEVIERQLLDKALPNTKHLTIAQQIKIGVQMFEEFSDNNYNLLFTNDLENTVQRWSGYNEHFALAYKAFHLFGRKKLEVVKYNELAIKNLMYEKFNVDIEEAIKKKVKELFEIRDYTTDQVKEMLQVIYDQLVYHDKRSFIRNPLGTNKDAEVNIRTANATHINKYCDVKYNKNNRTYTIYGYLD